MHSPIAPRYARTRVRTAQVLRNLCSTALLAAYAASEPSSGSDTAATATTATPAAAGGGYLLNGTKVCALRVRACCLSDETIVVM